MWPKKTSSKSFNIHDQYIVLKMVIGFKRMVLNIRVVYLAVFDVILIVWIFLTQWNISNLLFKYYEY